VVAEERETHEQRLFSRAIAAMKAKGYVQPTVADAGD
jgi:hypothetical protein